MTTEQESLITPTKNIISIFYELNGLTESTDNSLFLTKSEEKLTIPAAKNPYIIYNVFEATKGSLELTEDEKNMINIIQYWSVMSEIYKIHQSQVNPEHSEPISIQQTLDKLSSLVPDNINLDVDTNLKLELINIMVTESVKILNKEDFSEELRSIINLYTSFFREGTGGRLIENVKTNVQKNLPTVKCDLHTNILRENGAILLNKLEMCDLLALRNSKI